jgi:hypothetical protein
LELLEQQLNAHIDQNLPMAGNGSANWSTMRMVLLRAAAGIMVLVPLSTAFVLEVSPREMRLIPVWFWVAWFIVSVWAAIEAPLRAEWFADRRDQAIRYGRVGMGVSSRQRALEHGRRHLPGMVDLTRLAVFAAFSPTFAHELVQVHERSTPLRFSSSKYPSMPWRRPKLVAEGDTGGRTQDIYNEIKYLLGVPRVSAMFQAFAGYPKFLELFWRAVRSGLESAQFFRLGDRLRADAYTRSYNYFQVPDLRTGPTSNAASSQELSQTVELFHYVDPLLLLLSAVVTQALAKTVGQSTTENAAAEHPVFATRPLLISEESAPPRIEALYDDIKRTLGIPVLSTAYQAFARFPVFLEDLWRALKPITQSALYTESHAGLRQTAWSLAREFPARVELTSDYLSDAGLPDDDIAAVARITDIFMQSLSRTVLNVALAKIGLEGGSARSAAPAKAESEPKQAA